MKIREVHLVAIMGLVVGVIVALLFVRAFLPDSDSFGITICREKHNVLTGKVLIMHYYLVDENNNRRDVSLEVYDSLITIPECSAIEESR